jgi:hypothetical protein
VRCEGQGVARRARGSVRASARVGDMWIESYRRIEQGAVVAAAVGQGRQSVRARNLGCGGDCTLHFPRSLMHANGCAGSDRILQPAATSCQYSGAPNGKAWLTWRSCSDVW